MTKAQQSRKRVGILGGSFNPVHYGHLAMAEQAREQLQLDRCYLMPSYQPPHVDKKTTSPAEQRLAMLNLAIAGNAQLAIETCELTRGGVSYTYDTMAQLVKDHPDTDYYFIIGGDMVDYLPKWHRLPELLDLVTLVAVKRPGYGESSPYPLTWIDVPLNAVSSSLIRDYVAKGQSIRYLVPEAVCDYIQTKELYRHDEITRL